MSEPNLLLLHVLYCWKCIVLVTSLCKWHVLIAEIVFCVLHWEPNSPVSSLRLTSLCSLIVKKHRFCGKSLIHRSHLNSERYVQSSPSNVKEGGLSPRRRKGPNMLLKTVTEVNWKCQPLSRRQCLRPQKCHCLLRPKQLRLYHQQLPLTRVHQIEVSQKLSKYKLHLQLNVLWTLQLLLFSAKTRQLRSPRKLSIPLTRRRIPHEADKT